MGNRVRVRFSIRPGSFHRPFFFKDAEGKDQAAAIEVGSEILRNTVMVLEVRTGKKITYQDEQSQKNFGK